jgi:secondary thiamine-phosphate synthase enzyme
LKFLTEYLTFNTQKHREFINITSDVDRVLKKSGIKEGMILVSAMHITASVYVNDAESGLIKDIEEWLQKLAPEGPDYYHHNTGEVNGDAHLKNLLIGHQVIVRITFYIFGFILYYKIINTFIKFFINSIFISV